jgi:hypothetical protein
MYLYSSERRNVDGDFINVASMKIFVDFQKSMKE